MKDLYDSNNRKINEWLWIFRQLHQTWNDSRVAYRQARARRLVRYRLERHIRRIFRKYKVQAIKRWIVVHLGGNFKIKGTH